MYFDAKVLQKNENISAICLKKSKTWQGGLCNRLECCNFARKEKRILMTDKQQRYEELMPQLQSLIAGEKEEMSVLSNVSALLKERFGWFWIGFYLARNGELRLGPFQGSVACMHIAFDRGVCGAAYSSRQTVVVPDVEKFPGHIACSSLSRSEIVVPLFNVLEQPVGVLDIDSTELATFDETDRQYLEQVCRIISKELYGA